MRKSPLTAIFPGSAPWRVALDGGEPEPVAPAEADAESTSAEQARAVNQAAALSEWLRRRRAKAVAPVLVLPSRWCLAAPIETEGLLRRRRHAGLVYRLEEKLPLDAEVLAADFIEQNATALGVAVEAAPVAEVLEALEAEAITVGVITPMALLAVTELQRRQVELGELCLISSADGIDAVCLQEQAPVRWHHLPAEATALERELGVQALERQHPLRVSAVGLDPALEGILGARGDSIEIVAGQETGAEALASRCAKRIAAAGEAPPLDLRRERLAPSDRLQPVARPLTAALLALVLLAGAIAGVGFWRGVQYQQMTEQLEHQQRVLFEEAFPDQDVPAAVLARLRAELEQQQALRRAPAEAGQIEQRSSALELLAAALDGLPTDLRYRVLELRIDDQGLYLDGQARTHGDAEAIAAGLRQPGNWIVQPPRSEQRHERGVSFTLTGEPAQQQSERRAEGDRP